MQSKKPEAEWKETVEILSDKKISTIKKNINSMLSLSIPL